MSATLSTPRLNDDQIRQFTGQGFLVARDAFNSADMAAIARWTDDVLKLPEMPGRHWVFHEKSLKDSSREIVSRIENIRPFHEGYRKLGDVLKEPVSQLLGEEAVLFKEKINFKMPGGDGFKPHQDSQAGWDVYADFFVSVLLCIDEATVENGCIEIVAGHHKRGLFKSWEPLTEADMAGMTFVPCPTKPGDLIFFDCYAPHQSKPNLSDKTRRLYYATYNRLSAGDHQARYYADKRKNYPPDIERDPNKTYVFRV